MFETKPSDCSSNCSYDVRLFDVGSACGWCSVQGRLLVTVDGYGIVGTSWVVDGAVKQHRPVDSIFMVFDFEMVLTGVPCQYLR
jgi:hypothetical protein